MEIRSLSGVDSQTVFNAFQAAFADYEMQLDKAGLAAMLKRRGFDPHLSFASFEKGKITAFTLNGTGMYNGIPTAYDTGTGTLPAHRGRGLATLIFEYSIPHLKNAGIRRYLLEVLQHNEKAVSVYRKLGFETIREFNYFRQGAAMVKNHGKPPTTELKVLRIDLRTQSSVSGFWDFNPSWQNGFEAIERVPDEFISLGAFVDDRLASYCIFEPSTGDLTQLAVDPSRRRNGIASRLFDSAMEMNRAPTVKVINTDVRCSSITGFLQAKGIEVSGKQFEMVREI